MKLLDKYNKIKKEIFDYFGYVEDWRILPIDDVTDYYWRLFQNPDGSGEVIFADTPEILFDEDSGDYYMYEIYTQRFLPKWVYRGDEYTMIVVDTHVDDNKLLQIFDNFKEVKYSDNTHMNQ